VKLSPGREAIGSRWDCFLRASWNSRRSLRGGGWRSHPSSSENWTAEEADGGGGRAAGCRGRSGRRRGRDVTTFYFIQRGRLLLSYREEGFCFRWLDTEAGAAGEGCDDLLFHTEEAILAIVITSTLARSSIYSCKSKRSCYQLSCMVRKQTNFGPILFR
jgi:hypothetical protein